MMGLSLQAQDAAPPVPPPAPPTAPAPTAPAPTAPAPTAPAPTDGAAPAVPTPPPGGITPTPGAGGGRIPGFGRGGFGGPGGGGAPGAAGGAILGDRISLQFPLNPVSDLLSIYEKLVGKTILKDTSVFDGPQISLVTPADVNRQEAIQLIEATLLINGYVLVAEDDKQSIKVLVGKTRQQGQPSSFADGLVIYDSPEGLPGGETLAGLFMKLENISPEEAATLMGNHVQLNDFGRITPVSHPQGLLVTESSTVIRQLLKLKNIIDVPSEEASLITEFVQLEFAESNVIAQIIQSIMDSRREERERQSQQSGTISGQKSSDKTPTPTPQPQAITVRTSISGSKPDLSRVGVGTADLPASQIIPDDRMNRIAVIAPPTDAAYIIQLIKQFDLPADSPEPVERRLRHVKANDILSVVVDVLQDRGSGETILPGGRTIQTRSTPVSSSQLSTVTGTNRNTAQNNQNRTQQATTDSATNDGGRADQIAFPVDEVAPISVLIGKTRIIADRQSNTIIVVGDSVAQKTVLDIIDTLDRRPAQVYLATVIGEMTLDDTIQFGVDYLQKFTKFHGDNPLDGGIASSNINARDDVITNGNIADMRDNIITTAFGPAAGLNIYGQIGQTLDTVINALETTQRFKVLSRPVVYIQNGKRAEITSGQEVPVPTESLTDSSGQINNTAAVRTSIDYKQVVLKLEVLPTINEDNEVTLDIVQVNDRVIGTQRVADSDVPIVGKQELNTTVTVPNRSTIVLGGLISERKDNNDAGVPFIQRIPLLGHAFKNTNNQKTRTELMIFIQPIVVSDNSDLPAASYDEDVRSNVGEDAARVFPGPGTPTEMHQQGRPVERVQQPFFKRLFGGLKRKNPGAPPVPGVERVEEGTAVPVPPIP